MLKIAKEEDCCRVELFQVNKLNTLFSELVKQQLIELVEEHEAPVVFNLEGIHFIDSSGFDVLLAVSDRAREVGRQFSLCNITDDVKELMGLLELEDKLSFCDCVLSKEKILLALD
jgi:anti-anti-sigma factor